MAKFHIAAACRPVFNVENSLQSFNDTYTVAGMQQSQSTQTKCWFKVGLKHHDEIINCEVNLKPLNQLLDRF